MCGKVIGFLCKVSKKFATMQIYTFKIFCSPFKFSVTQGCMYQQHRALRVFAERQKKCFSCFAFYIFCNTFTACSIEGSTKFAALFRKRQTAPPVSMWSLRSLVISHFRKKNLPNCSLYKYIYLNIYLYRA